MTKKSLTEAGSLICAVVAGVIIAGILTFCSWYFMLKSIVERIMQ